MNAYNQLLEHVKESTLLGTAAGFLNWDMLTNMPPKGTMIRGETLGILSKIIHRMQVSTEYSTLLAQAEKSADLENSVVARNLFLLRREYELNNVIPENLVGEMNKQRAISNQAWAKAKENSDWKHFEPELKKSFEISNRVAELMMEVKGTATLYDTLLDEFEPGMKSKKVAKIFSDLRDGLVPMIRKLSEKSAELDGSKLKRKVPIEIQKTILNDLASLIGYDTTSENASGRIDETNHPFTIGYFDDVRITVRYDENNPFPAIAVFLHEGGHAIYEQSFNPDWIYQPVGAMASLGIHESISRFYENMIGRSPEFWSYYLPRLNELTNGTYSDLSLEEFLPLGNRVSPSKIRVEADELTYSLHVIIRFEIEQGLFSGEYSISDLPQVWNEKYDEYLGVTIKDDKEGVLQDSHWSAGMFGYFPTYALGNLYNGMWYKKMTIDEPTWREDVANGNLKTAYNWLVGNVMSKANLYNPDDLVRSATGYDLVAEPFLDYLNDKYSMIF